MQGRWRCGTEHPSCAAGVEKIVVVADMESYSDSAVPSMATRIECLRLAQVSHPHFSSRQPAAVGILIPLLHSDSSTYKTMQQVEVCLVVLFR